MREAPPTLEDVLAASRVVAQIARSHGEAVAVAWAIRNRAREAILLRRTDHRRGGGFGDGSISGAARSLLRDVRPTTPKAPSGRRILRAASAVCAVLSGVAPDPTFGATWPPGWAQRSYSSGLART